jgi:hypothetical protein
MPVRLIIRPDIAHKLTALAKARGVSVDDLLQEVLDDLELPQDTMAEPSAARAKKAIHLHPCVAVWSCEVEGSEA